MVSHHGDMYASKNDVVEGKCCLKQGHKSFKLRFVAESYCRVACFNANANCQ